MVARAIDHPASIGVIPTPYNPDPVLLAIVQTIRDGLIRDQHVRLHNFGTFRIRWSKERRIKHPKTGEYIIAAPTPRITFTPAKYLRERIEPNPKPVIPLSEEINIRLNIEKEIVTREPDQTDPEASLKYNLQNTVQDILDEECNPTNRLLEEITPTAAGTEADNTENITSKFSDKKWAIGLLSAVPLILLMLQTDFNTETVTTTATKATVSRTTTANTTISKTTTEINSNLKLLADDNISTNKIIRSEIIGNTNTEESTKTIATPSPIITARPEPTPNSFYMRPQLHTVKKGENLWNLAKEYYGDALLWPHIYRANIRTINNPDIISTSNKLVIPGLQQSPERLSNNDRDLVAEGYFKVYQLNKTKNSQQSIYFLIGAKQYSFDWLKRNRQDIPPKDWKLITSRIQ